MQTGDTPGRPATILPPDEAHDHDRALLANVHPADWTHPQVRDRYHLVVVGAGTAGLVAAAGAAGLGAKVALVEKHLMGGDCLNHGCVPSKALIRSARAAAAVRDAPGLGIQPHAALDLAADFPAVMQRMRRLRASISPHDSAARFRDLGVDVFLGEGRFTGTDRLEVGGRELIFRKAVIATGTRPTIPPIAGLDATNYLTNETVFSLTRLPVRLAVIGAGPIGCELAQVFARLGSRVSLFASSRGLLPREERDAVSVVEQALIRDGVSITSSSLIKESLTNPASSESVLAMDDEEGNRVECGFDAMLVAVGRTPNVERLGLEKAGVAFDQSGVVVDDFLRTTNRRIFAAGDVASRFKFTHAADAMARIAVQNALFLGRARASALVIPWSTYTDPEIARVGLSMEQADERGIAVTSFVQEFSRVDRSILDGSEVGFARVLVRRGSDRIVGATIVGEHAGELISEITLAMTSRLGLKHLAKTIHPYPTRAEALRKIGDAYNRTRLNPFVLRLLRGLLEIS